MPKTYKQREEEYKRLQPDEVKKVATIYGQTFYIPKERRTNGFYLPCYHADGRRLIDSLKLSRETHYHQVMLHPDNILTPYNIRSNDPMSDLRKNYTQPADQSLRAFIEWTLATMQGLGLACSEADLTAAEWSDACAQFWISAESGIINAN